MNAAEKYYSRIGDALKDVAGRSFYEDCLVYPTELDGELVYRVTDSRLDVEAFYSDGALELQGECDQHTRLMDPCEFFNEAIHIGYHFADEVETLIAREGCVWFSYQPVTDLESDPEDDEYLCGWVLVSKTYLFDGTEDNTVIV